MRSQLAEAANTYTSHVDLSARLELIREVGNNDQDDGTSVSDS
jgi:hypothetical protein